MKRGHVTGHKHEKTGQGWWMQTEEYEELIRQAQADEAARKAQDTAQ
jgi:hypothetical protein